MSAPAFAKALDAVLILDVQDLPDGVRVLKVPCADFDAFRALPKAVEHGGRPFGLTGWDSDMCLACYRSDAELAFRRTSVG